MHYKNTNYVGTDQKLCTACKEVKPLEQFTASTRDRYSSTCRKCATARMAIWRSNNRERSNATSKRSKQKNAQSVKASEKERRAKRKLIAGSGPIPERKVCTKCLESKTPEKFRKSMMTMDGRTTICCTCNAIRIKAWRETRSDKERALSRARYQKDPKRARARSKKFTSKNRERSRQQSREWYQKNAESAMRRALAWAKSHPEETNERIRRRNKRIRSLPGFHTLAEWKAMCISFDGRCVRCGVKGPLTRDHIIPVSNPESSEWIENLQPMCRSCNLKKSNTQIVDYRKTPFTFCGQALLILPAE